MLHKKEDYDAVKELLALFGDGVRRHLLIVFTGGDELGVPIGKCFSEHRQLHTIKTVLFLKNFSYCCLLVTEPKLNAVVPDT